MGLVQPIARPLAQMIERRGLQTRFPLVVDDFAGRNSLGSAARVGPDLSYDGPSSRWGWVDDGNGPVLKKFAADEPRINTVDPATGEQLGYLAEKSRTNELLDNRQIDSPEWSGGATITQDQTGLDDTTSGWSITGGERSQTRSVADNSNTHTVSAFWRKDAADSRLEARFKGGTTELTYTADLSVSDGSVTAGGDAAASDITVTDAGAFWRVEIAGANNGSGNTSIQKAIRPVDTSQTAAYDWGQIELNANFATSPIETGSTPVTRAADDMSSALPDAAKDGFVVVALIRAAADPEADFQYIFESEKVSEERAALILDNSGPLRLFTPNDGDITDTGNTPSPNANVKIAARYESGRYALSVNGRSALTDGTSGFPDLSADLKIGTNGTGGETLNSTIAKIEFYTDPENWTDADLEEASKL